MQQMTFGQLTEGRENNFDFLRFLMASLVIFAHSFGFVHGDTYSGADPLDRLTHWQLGFGSLAVQCFFLISGFLVTRSWIYSKGVGDFAKKRALRIIPALAVVLLVIVFVIGPLATTNRSNYFRSLDTYKYLGIMFTHDFRTGDHLPGVFLHNPWPRQLDSSLWTIRYEVACYVLVGLLGIAGLYRKRRAVLGIFVAAYIAYALSETKILHLGSFAIFHALITFFLAGMLLFLYRERIPYSAKWAAVSLAVLVGSAFVHVLTITMPLFGAYILFYVAYSKTLKLHAFARHGDLSYGIYIYAFPVQQLLVYFSHNSLSPFLLFLVTLLIVSGLAALSWHLVEKPFLKLKASARSKTPDQAEVAADQAKPRLV